MKKNSCLSTLITIGDWIRYATSRFKQENLHFGHGYDSAWDEAVQLVLTALHLPHDISPNIFQCAILLEERETLLELIERRINTRTPLAYLIHEAWFCGLPFYVDKRVLIPRSPIGEWINRQFVPWLEVERVDRILDIGTGSGCIAIAAALAFPQAQVDAVDISADALAVAAINVERHDLKQRLTLHESDCFAQLSGHKYDLIISNPPYVAADELAELPVEYQHEPYLALHATDDGMAIVAKILAQAAQHLTDDGILVIEVGHSQEALLERFGHLPLIWLDLEQGGQGVFLVTGGQLREM